MRLVRMTVVGVLAFCAVAFVLFLVPRVSTLRCPNEPVTVVLLKDYDRPEAGYCLHYLDSRRNFVLLLDHESKPICGATSEPLQAQADALYVAAKSAHERCVKPPSLAAAARFWGGLFGLSVGAEDD